MIDCKYCKEKYYSTMNEETVAISGLEIALSCSTSNIRVRAYLDKEYFETQEFVNINFCPMCRQKVGDNQ